jgi:hypothetical protein
VGVSVWGLNQEGLGAGGLILSRVLASRVGKEARPAMQQLLQKNDEAYRRAVQSGRIFDLPDDCPRGHAFYRDSLDRA